MTTKDIIEKITPAVEERGCFLVDVTVSAENDIEVEIESTLGTVTMEDCVSIDKAFHNIWNQDEEDYSLTVSSAGLDRPFKVLPQYVKAIGSQVVARLKGGRKFVATLTGADENFVNLAHVEKVPVMGARRKEETMLEERIPLSEVNSITYYISFD